MTGGGVDRRITFEIDCSAPTPDGSHEGPVRDEIQRCCISDTLVKGGGAGKDALALIAFGWYLVGEDTVPTELRS